MDLKWIGVAATVLVSIYAYFRLLGVMKALERHCRVGQKSKPLEPIFVVHHMRSDRALVAYGDYFRAASELRKKTAEGQLSGSVAELDIQIDSLRYIAIQYLLFRRHPELLFALVV